MPVLSTHARPGSTPPASKKQKSHMGEVDRTQKHLLSVQKNLTGEANRAQKYLLALQPGRISLADTGFYPENCGGQGIMPSHVHNIGLDVSDNGTSTRRYNPVMFVEVPEKELAAWRAANIRKKKQCPLLAQFDDSGMKYACLKCTHFVNSHKLIAEGNRTYMNLPDGQAMKLLPDDEEGRIIQKQGVLALVYGPDLWYDQSALMALMREDNANVDVAKPETELDGFGLVGSLSHSDFVVSMANDGGDRVEIDSDVEASDANPTFDIDARGWTTILFPIAKKFFSIRCCGKIISVPPQSNIMLLAVNPVRTAADEWTVRGHTLYVTSPGNIDENGA
jgi:hypothetical protein